MFTAPPSDRGACWRRHDRTPRRSDRRWRGGRTKGREVRDSRLSNYPRRFNGWPARIYPAELADRRALTRRAQVGPHPLLVRGSEGRPEAQVRDGRHVPTFRDAYRGRRCILPADGVLRMDGHEGWQAPYALPFGASPPSGKTEGTRGHACALPCDIPATGGGPSARGAAIRVEG